jgi:ATP-dependent protease Clp ATPase subunit
MKATGIICLAALVAIAACTKLCSSGYEGSDCNTLAKTKFIGVWTVTLPPTGVAYLDTISSASGAPNITISRAFAAYTFAHAINATVSNNMVTIPLQQPDSNSNTVQGTGTLAPDSKSITWIYQVNAATDTSVWTK